MHGQCAWALHTHAPCAREKKKRDREHGTWQIPSLSHMATAGGHSFFLFMMVIFDLGKPWIFYFTCLTLLYCTVPTYVRSPSFSEKQGRSDQVILFCLGTRPNSKGEILLLVHGTAGTSGCHVARKFIICLSVSLSLSSDEQESVTGSICQITHAYC